MRNFVPALAGLAGLLAVSSALAATFIPVAPVAGGTETDVSAINDRNEITGIYFDSQGVIHGFAGAFDGTYEKFDAGDTNTLPSGIDKKGDIVGTAFSTSLNCTASAFERNAKGKIQPVKKGRSNISGSVAGMDAGGDFIGIYCDGNGSHLFVGKKAKYDHDVTISGAHVFAVPGGINSAGDVDGSVQDPDGKIRGFLLKDGITTEITYPGADQTQMAGLNDKGIASGVYIIGGIAHGFIYDTSTEKFTSVEPSGATTSGAGSINNDGLVAVTSDIGSFIYCPKKQNKCPAGGAH